jgi:hypothetical protein
VTEHTPRLASLLAGALALSAPPVSLLLYHVYPLQRPESLIYLALWATAGALGGLLARRSGRGVGSMVWASLLILSFDLQFQFLGYRFPLAGLRLGDKALRIIVAGYAVVQGF